MSTVLEIQRQARRRQRGLTLLEVVVGLTILALMSGAIYAIVGGSVESTAGLARIQAEDRRIETFLHRCRARLCPSACRRQRGTPAVGE